jgi:hypothetical protein
MYENKIKTRNNEESITNRRKVYEELKTLRL